MGVEGLGRGNPQETLSAFRNRNAIMDWDWVLDAQGTHGNAQNSEASRLAALL